MAKRGRLPNPLASAAVVSIVGGWAKLVLSSWCASARVTGLERFLQVLLDEKRRRQGRGLLTYANHISVMDEPTLFGCMPMHTFRQEHTTRWTLGATDILFTNSVLSWIFRTGQVIATDRGRGAFQPAIDEAIETLERGSWVHIFPEGYVNVGKQTHLRRFKWGVGRLLLEAGRRQHWDAMGPASGRVVDVGAGAMVGGTGGVEADKTEAAAATPTQGGSARPVIVPIWLSGFDELMPEHRGFPRFLPRPGARVSITFGEPIDAEVHPYVDWLLSDLRGARARASGGALGGDEGSGEGHAGAALGAAPTNVNRADGSSSSRASSSFPPPSKPPSPPPPSPSASSPPPPPPPPPRSIALSYPSPPPSAFPPLDVVPRPAEGWPPPGAGSRSAHVLALGGDSEAAQRARSLVAAELRAHLVRLGDEVERREGKRTLVHEVPPW